MLYVLPVNENMFPHSYMVLDGLIENLQSYEGVLMCSMYMLPKRPERRKRVVDKILDQRCTLHLVLEDLVIGSARDFARMEEYVLLSRLIVKEPSPAILE